MTSVPDASDTAEGAGVSASAEGGLSGYVGPFQLLRRIGQGAMGTVYLARSIHPSHSDEPLALKLLHRDRLVDPLQLEQARAEGYLLSLLEHPNIVRVLQSGTHHGQLYLAMEYVGGGTLAALSARLASAGVRLPPALAWAILDELLRGLEYLQRASDASGAALRVVHRDVCPANVFLSAAGRVLLGDFGLALAAAGADRARQGLLAGHLGYMPPEQMEGAPVDGRCDVYAAAALFFELLFGQLPYPGTSLEAVYELARAGRVVRPPAAEPALWSTLADLLARALDPRPARRLGAEELRLALGRALGPAPLAAAALAGVLRADPATTAGAAPGSARSSDGALTILAELDSPAAALAAELGAPHGRVVSSPAETLDQASAALIVDGRGRDPAALRAIPRRQRPVAVLLLGELSSASLELAVEADFDYVEFWPWRTAELRAALCRPPPPRTRDRTPLVLTSAPTGGRLAARRVLLAAAAACPWGAGVTAALVAEGAVVRRAMSAEETLELAARTSFHALLLDGASIPEEVGERFLALPGYQRPPRFVIGGGTIASLLRRGQGLVRLPAEADTAALGLRVVDALLAQAARGFTRFPANLPGRISYRGVATPCRLRNLSRLGALVAQELLVPLGSRVELLVALPHSARELGIPARVAHLDRDQDALVLVGLDLAPRDEEQEMLWLTMVLGKASQPAVAR